MASQPTFRRPSSLDEARTDLTGAAVAVAGGTEVVPLLRDGLLNTDVLVDVSSVLPAEIERTDTGVRLGAGVALAEIEHGHGLPTALTEACRLAASPQIRNGGTIAGNLLQETRCWYWRLGHDCWLRGGERCLARDGQGSEHAIVGNVDCASGHPSDPAAALLALDTTVITDRRELPLVELYRLPTDADRRVTSLEPGELITALQVSEPEASVYLKAMDRNRFAFPLVGIAAAKFGDTTRVALAGIAPVPWFAGTPEQAASLLESATPVAGAEFKIEVAGALLDRAVEAVG